jgi:hypothetical protein
MSMHKTRPGGSPPSDWRASTTAQGNGSISEYRIFIATRSGARRGQRRCLLNRRKGSRLQLRQHFLPFFDLGFQLCALDKDRTLSLLDVLFHPPDMGFVHLDLSFERGL